MVSVMTFHLLLHCLQPIKRCLTQFVNASIVSTQSCLLSEAPSTILVLSPVLFCIYIDNLLKSLADIGVGCYIGSHFVGALAYADDIVLLAPTASAMRRLLAVCDEYSQEYCIAFNVSKTKSLVVVPRSRQTTFDRVGECLFSINN